MIESSSNRGFSLSGSYWYIKGLDIKGAGDNGMYVSGSYNTIEYCTFSYNRDSGLQLSGGASNNRIINCDSYCNADAANGNADGFAVKMDVGTGNYYYGCRSWQNSDDGWDGYMRGADDVSTTLENCWCFMNGYLSTGAASSGNGNGFKLGGSDDKTLRHNFTLKNCLSFDNRVKGFDQNNNLGSMTLYNCTGYRNGTNYSFYLTLDTANGKVLTLKNCAALGSYGSITIPSVQATNSWMSGFTVTTADFQSIDTTGIRGARNSDGSLPTTTFMHLAPGSDLIDVGTDVGITYSGSAPDLGAFETNASVSLATVTTTAIISITQTTATGGGTVTSAGGGTVTACGICWNTSGNPTVSDSHTSDGTGTGTFTGSLTGLTAGTLYYVRAYATNAAGTAYGSAVSFTTASAVISTLSTTAISSISYTTAAGGGSITDSGGATVTARGICWNTSGTPTISDSHTSDGTGTGTFISSLSSLASGTLYYVRAYATNSAGTAYSSAVSFTTLSISVPTVTTTSITSITQTTASGGGTVSSNGGATVTARGICWNTSGAPAISDSHTSDSSGTGTFTSALSSLSPGTRYYVRAYATNSAGTAYGDTVSFTTLAITLPTVITASVSSISTTSAACGGTVSSDGGATVTARGVCWSTSSSPTLANSYTANGTGTGSFTSSISSLTAGTKYYVRAYATNSIGTAYGVDGSFTTLTTTLSDSVKWVLTANQTCTSGTYIKGTSQVLSSGDTTVTLKVKDYNAGTTGGGERCNLGTTYWPTESAQNDGRYIEFDMAPVTGYDFIAASVSFDVGYSATTGNMQSNLYYSTDNWVTRTKINSSNIVSSSNAWNSPASSYAISVSVLSGATLSFRLYPWLKTTPSTTKYLSMRNFVVKGTSSINSAYLSGKVKVSVIPQGFYNSAGYLNAADTVKIILANAVTPYAYVDSASVLLDSLSFSAAATFSSAANGNYFLVVKHRNCVETWSASAITFSKGSTASYDFTDAQTKAYGSNLIQVSESPVRWAIYSGDVNQDGYVDPLDLSLVDIDSYNYVSGRGLATDINGDGYVDPLDLSITDANSYNYVGVVKPASAKIMIRQARVLHK
jgi:parallel beta-helix repeat protein